MRLRVGTFADWPPGLSRLGTLSGSILRFRQSTLWSGLSKGHRRSAHGGCDQEPPNLRAPGTGLRAASTTKPLGGLSLSSGPANRTDAHAAPAAPLARTVSRL